MTIDEILNEFSQRKGYFPKKAVEAAIAQKEIIIPHLLDHLHTVVEMGDSITEGDRELDITLFAIFLLGEFRETRAYPLIIKVVSAAPATVDYLIGDTITEGLNRILASVYDGDLIPLKSLIEGDSVDEFVRGSALRTFIPLYEAEMITREAVLEYFTSLFRGGLTRQYNQVWNVLCSVAEEFGFSELLPDIRQAFTDELTEPFYGDEDYLEKELVKHAGTTQFDPMFTGLIDNTVAELKDWACFQPKPKPVSIPQERFIHRDTTLFRGTPKVGRNDPCPCNSGKKYKKCCGR